MQHYPDIDSSNYFGSVILPLPLDPKMSMFNGNYTDNITS